MASDDLKLGIRITADSKLAVQGVAQTTTAVRAFGQETVRTKTLAQQMAESVSRQYAQQMVAGMSRAAAEARRAGAEIERSGSQAARGIRSISEQLARLESLAKAFFITKAAIVSFSGVARGLFEAGTQAQRLQNTLAFATGGVETARKEMDFLRQTSEQLGLEFLSSSQAYAKLAAAAHGTALEGQKTRDIFTAIAKAATVMGLSAQETQGAIFAIGQMISKGTVASEELRGQLGERLPGAFQIAARAMGATTAELGKMLEQGQVLADVFLPRFARELDRSVGLSATSAAGGALQQLNRLSNAWLDFKTVIADSGFLDVAGSALGELAEIAKAAAHALQITPPSPDAKRVRLSEVERAIDDNSRKVDRDRRDVREFDRLRGERDKLRSEIAEIERRQRLLNATAHLNVPAQVARGGFDAIARSNFEAISAAAQHANKLAEEARRQAERDEKQRLAEVETARKRIAAIVEDTAESEQAFQRDLAAQQAKGAQEEIERMEGLQRKRREQLEDGVRALQESTETELEAEDRRHRESLRLVEEFERRRQELQLDATVDTARLREQLERDHLQRTNRIIEEQTREQRELLLEPFKNALRGIQQTFTDTFEQIFSGGIKSFADLGSAIKRIFVRLAAEIASLLVFRPVVAQVLGAVGLGSLSGDLLGAGAASGSGFSASSLLSGGSSLKSLFGGGAGFIDKFGAKLGFDSALQTGARFPGATLGATLGAAGLGALGGGLIAGLLGGNQTVGSIGGGLGAGVGFALGGPIGALLGGAGGGLLGGLFGGGKKVKTITQTNPLPGVGEAVSGALRDIAQILGVTAPAIAVSAVEQVMSKTKKNDFRTAFVLAGGQRFNDAQAAVEGLLAQALRAITGLPAHLQRAVEQAAGLSAAAARDFLASVKDAFEGLQTELTGLPAVVTAALAPFREKFKAAIEAGLSPKALALWQQAATDFEAMTAQVLAARDAYGALLTQQADGLRALRKEFEDFAQSIGEFRDSLLTGDLSTLSPLGKLDEARSRFELVGAKAQLGDREALGQLTDAAQLLLSLSRKAFASGPDFVADFDRVRGVLAGAQGTAGRQAQVQSQQISGLEAQLKDLGLGSQSPLTVEQAKAAFESSVQSLAGAVSARLPELAKASLPPTIPPAPSFGPPPGGWSWGEVGLGGATLENYAALVNQVGRGGGGGAAHSWELVHRDGQVILREIDKGTRRGTQERATRLQATLRGIRGFASGGLAMPGLALVGEEGPEIVRFRSPARVHTAQETRAMMAGGGDVERLLKEIHLAQRESDRFQIRQLQAQTEALTDELRALRREMRRSAA